MFQYFVEFISTILFAYVAFSTGNPLAIASVYALLLLLTKNITNGYMNPAIVIAMASNGTIQSGEVILYCLSQIFGALVALEIYKRFRL